MKNWTMALAFCTLLPTMAAAQQGSVSGAHYDIQTGDDLNKVCVNPAGKEPTAAERERLLVCGSYIRGYLAYYSVARNLTQGKGFCLPDSGVSAEKLRLLYIGVVEKKPEIRDYPAAIDLATILQAAYPCTGKTAK